MESHTQVYVYKGAARTLSGSAQDHASWCGHTAGASSSDLRDGLLIRQVQRYRSFQDDENKVVVYDLLSRPDEYVAHFERYATSVVSIIGFGRRVAKTTDPLITEVIALMQNAAGMAVVAKDFPRLMESFPCP